MIRSRLVVRLIPTFVALVLAIVPDAAGRAGRPHLGSIDLGRRIQGDLLGPRRSTVAPDRKRIDRKRLDASADDSGPALPF